MHLISDMKLKSPKEEPKQCDFKIGWQISCELK